MARLRLDATDPANPLLYLDETGGVSQLVDLSGVNRIVVDIRPGKTIPVLILEVPLTGTVDLDARLVERSEGVESDDQVIRKFVEKLNPAELEEAMLESTDFSMTTGVAVQAALRRMVASDGDHSGS